MIRGVTESYYDVQHVRIEIENQLRAYRQGGSEQDEDYVFFKENVLKRMLEAEKMIAKYLNQQNKGFPIYTLWLKNINGVGPILSARLIAMIEDIERFATISKLWRYCGLAVAEDGHAEKKKKGEKLHFDPRMKVLCWKIGESFVKKKGGYRTLYEKFRAEYDEKWKTPEDCGSVGCKNKKKCLDGHRYMAAKRKTVKVFLAHLWQKWREIKGLPVENVFIIGREDSKHHTHEHVIPIVES